MNLLKRLSFRNKIFLSCLLAGMIPVLLSGVVMLYIFSASLRHQVNGEGNRQADELYLLLDSLITDCETACRELTRDGSAARVMIDNTSVDIQRDLFVALYQSSQQLSGNGQLHLYDAGGVLAFSTGEQTPKRLPLYWGLLKKSSLSNDLLFYAADPHLSFSSNSVLLQAVYPLKSLGGAKMGYVVLDFTREDLERILHLSPSREDIVLLLDSHDRPFYCSRTDYDYQAMEALVSKGLQTETKIYSKRFFRQDTRYGLSLLLCHQAPITAPVMSVMQTVNITLSLLGMALSILVTILLTDNLSRPVRQLNKAMSKVQQGDLSVRIMLNRQDELGQLGKSFNHMTEDLDTYLKDALQKQKDLNKTTLKLYQTQLNPHFVYNTLDTIKWSGRIHSVPEISLLAEHLALILRKSISSKPFVLLETELETIDSYIAIQKIRFSGRFLFETEIPDTLLQCFVPKLILQPLVENAIVHGLEGSESGYICIYASREEDHLLLSVTDDGCGMPRDMVDWMNHPDPPRIEGHLGLYNLIQILKMYYGPEYGMKAEVTPYGTTVTLTLPIQKEEPHV